MFEIICQTTENFKNCSLYKGWLEWKQKKPYRHSQEMSMGGWATLASPVEDRAEILDHFHYEGRRDGCS